MKRPGLFWMLALLLLPPGLHAQDVSGRGWEVYQRFQGSSNSIGQILKLDTGITFFPGAGFSISAGLPYYVVHDGTGTTSATVGNGIGNAYAALGYTASDSRIGFSTLLQVSAPTGDETRGFSTGDVTVEWSNTLSIPLGRFTPFGILGVANTVSDTSFFTRPFSSIGIVGQFQGGLVWTPTRRISLGGSGYAVVPAGDQTLVRRVATPSSGPGTTDTGTTPPGPGGGIPGGGGPPFPTPGPVGSATSSVGVPGDSGGGTSGADLARDHGFSSWFRVYLSGNSDFYVGYSRSVPYELDSLFVGFGWSLGPF